MYPKKCWNVEINKFVICLCDVIGSSRDAGIFSKGSTVTCDGLLSFPLYYVCPCDITSYVFIDFPLSSLSGGDLVFTVEVLSGLNPFELIQNECINGSLDLVEWE